MGRKIKNASIVITGASSGIGRATALRLAKSGAWLTLIARREEPLETLRAEVERTGGRALVVPADVTDADTLRDAARVTHATYGRIDAWVNNAGVFALGELEATPDDVFHRIMEVNFHGYVYGARAVLPFFRAQGDGVLVNIGSLESRITAPFSTAYASSKFAVRALSKSLRQELRGSGIAVCTVLPPSTDTPLFDHSANFTGKRARPMEPVVSPERIAAAIVSCIKRPRAELLIGLTPRMVVGLHTLAPRLLERVMATNAELLHFTRQKQDATRGNLYAPVADGEGVSGGWRETPAAWLKRGLKVAAVGGVASMLVRGLTPRRRGLRRLLTVWR